MALPKSVTLCECWARDGLQSIPQVIPTEHKLEMLHRFMRAGVRKMEVTSFSHPKLLPQFADCVEVLKRIERRPGMLYVVLVPNEKGFDRLEVCQKEGYGADQMTLGISASEAHNKVNFRMTHDEAKRSHAAIMKRARAVGIETIGCTMTAYGCPIEGDVSMRDVIDITRFYVEEGASTLMLADTIGAANPLQVRQRFGELRALFPRTPFLAHFHDTRGNGVLNTFTALEMGVEFIDTSLGAIGGQPATGARKYQGGQTGNTCTEDMAALLAEVGVETGIDLEQLFEAGRRAEEVVGSPQRSNIIHSGRVRHAPEQYRP